MQVGGEDANNKTMYQIYLNLSIMLYNVKRNPGQVIQILYKIYRLKEFIQPLFHLGEKKHISDIRS